MSPLPLALLALIAAPDIIRDRTPLETYLENIRRGGRSVPGELLVTLRSIDHEAAVMSRSAELGCKKERRLGNRPIYLIECRRDAKLELLIAAWEKIEGVAWIDAGYLEDEEAMPNDLDASQWYHQNLGQRIDGFDGVVGADIGSIDAWDLTTGDQKLVIMVSDIGIYTGHDDLADQIWVNEDEDCSNGIDDDGNGYVDDCRGWDFADDDNDPDPTSLPALRESGEECPKWHATMIAGLAGARGNNETGVAGVNWQVSLMNVKKHRDVSCLSNTTRTIESIFYAIDNGAHVISMSFNSSSYDATFEGALQEAERAGLLMVSSGGNGGTDNDLEERYPNQYDVAASLVVANSTNQDLLFPGSNWGASTVDMAAPGTAVVSTSIGGPDDYGFGTGASFSAGFAAGAATIVWAAFPALTNLEVTRAIEEGVRPLDSMDCAITSRCVRTGGRIDLYGALKRASEMVAPSLIVDAKLLDGRLSLMNMGRGAIFGLAVRIADAGGLEVVTGEATIGNVASGASIDLEDSLRLTPPASCAPFDATVMLAFSDRFGRSWNQSVSQRIECVSKPVEPMEPDQEGDLYDSVEDERSGCSSIGGASASILWLLGAALVLLRRRG